MKIEMQSLLYTLYTLKKIKFFSGAIVPALQFPLTLPPYSFRKII
jgi:hypothetical protein